MTTARPYVLRERIHAYCSLFAENWALSEPEIEAGVLARLDGVQWPTGDQIALAASRECQAKARERPQPR